MKLFSKDVTIESHGTSTFAKGLGWFSIAIGLAELVAPRALSRLIGTPHRRVILGLLGIREIANGIGLLQTRHPQGWLWGRVAGDVMDLGLLGAALASGESERSKTELAAAAVLGVTVLDAIAARNAPQTLDEPVIHFSKTVTINRPPEVVYGFWRNFENLPRFMHNLESVTPLGLTHSHWVAKGPAGQTVEWDAEILEDVPNRLISWRSLEGADVENAGAVRFDPSLAEGGTIVRVDISYRPPAGMLGMAFAKLFGKAPDQEVQGDLSRFKQVIETGDVKN